MHRIQRFQRNFNYTSKSRDILTLFQLNRNAITNRSCASIHQPFLLSGNNISYRYFYNNTKKKTETKLKGNKKTGKAAQKKGLVLERRVMKLLKKEGNYNVETNVFLKDRHGNRSEIDVTYHVYPSWWPFNNNKRYVECKSYSSHSVPLEDVSKFKSVLELNNINEKYGVFITTSTFSPRCKSAAGKIKLINGDELKIWERKLHSKYSYKNLFWQTLVIGGLAYFGIELYITDISNVLR